MEYRVVMAPTIQEFLSRKGGVGLLSVLNERGKTYSEIESEVAITSDTISKRKDEGLDIGLIEMKPARRNNRTVTEYHLTGLGEELVQQMALMGIVSNYQSMRTHQRELDAKTAELIAWVNETPSQLLEFTESHEETLLDRSETDDEDDASEPDGNDNDEPSPRVVRPHPDDIDQSRDESNDRIEHWEDENQSSLAEMEDDEDGDAGDEETPEDKVERINRILEDADGGRDLSYEEPEYPDEFMVDSGADDDDSTDEDEVPEELQPHEVWGEEPDEGDDEETG